VLAHTALVTAIVEVANPYLIATSSMNCSVKLWSFADLARVNMLAEWKVGPRGVLGMTLASFHGATLATYGFETVVRLWIVDPLLSKVKPTKYQGHLSLVICCRAATGSPSMVSIDEKANIRIWDYRDLETLQVLNPELPLSHLHPAELFVLP